MSRIGNLAISIPNGVEISVNEINEVTVKGPKATLKKSFSPLMSINISEGKVHITRANEEKHTKQLHGTTRALLNGMVVGVTEGFTKKLKIEGIGFRASLAGKDIVLSVGYSHTITLQPLPLTEITLKSPTEIIVSGSDKQAVGQMAALIRGAREPEPYGGKGIMYVGEKIRRKVGKKAGKK